MINPIARHFACYLVTFFSFSQVQILHNRSSAFWQGNDIQGTLSKEILHDLEQPAIGEQMTWLGHSEG